MLNIPNEVKALFKNGSAFKNFHVHFPNGENADLNNDDIVAESVQFTESICSKEVFQFGLSERSQIEFECVGVQNIFGMTIECAIEICLELLEDEAQFIADHPNTGNEAFLDPQVCTYNGRNMYRVPYGRFIIESCPRSQGAMKHRKVTAYDLYGGDRIRLNTFLNYKFNSDIWQNEQNGFYMLQNIPLLFACNNNDISDISVTETVTTITNVRTASFPVATWENGNAECSITFNHERTAYFTNYASQSVRNNKNILMRATCSVDLTNVTPIIERLKELKAPTDIVKYATAVLTVGYCMNKEDASTTGMFPFDDPQDTGFVYGYANETGSSGICFNTGNITTVDISVDGTVETFTPGTVVTNIQPTIYELNDANQIAYNIYIEPTGNFRRYTTYINAIDYAELIGGYAELHGTFGRTNRTGNTEFITISKSSPIAMTPAEYSELWWDEYNVEPVGRITAQYKDIDIGQDQTVDYVINDSDSVYEMLDNYVLKNLNISEDDLNGITLEQFVSDNLNVFFVPKLADISFTPVTLDALGLPYLEAGDYLEIDDADGGTVGTYILSRTLSGIQTLTDSIEAKGGEVLGNG